MPVRAKYGYRTRIKIQSPRLEAIQSICNEIITTARNEGAKISGPIYLPTKRLVVPVRRAVSGNGSATWDKWELRIHRRLIDIQADERTIRKIMRIQVPPDVRIEIKML